jgi:nucleoside-diphosphate-sugar epimerase
MYFQMMQAGQVIQAPPRGHSFNSLIHEEDIVRSVEPLLKAATVPATILNWNSGVATDERELIEYVAAISGLAPKIEEDPKAGFNGGIGDVTALTKIAGRFRDEWRQGVFETLSKRFPEHRFRSV